MSGRSCGLVYQRIILQNGCHDLTHYCMLTASKHFLPAATVAIKKAMNLFVLLPG